MSVSDLRAKGLSLETCFEAGASLVLGDGARLQQIVWNLMKNAVKFTPSDGRIEVRTWNPDASTIAVSVTDSGIGISSEALPRIFSAFEQADDSITRAFGGLGLGLAIASTLAQKHGGTLTAQSEGRDKGARFTLTLPLVKAEPERESSPNATAEPNAAGRSLKVLLVEDNEYTSSAMAEVLEVLGHQVAVASGRRSRLRKTSRSTCSFPISACRTAAGSTSRARGRPCSRASGRLRSPDTAWTRTSGAAARLASTII
jgi:hypothetical protein